MESTPSAPAHVRIWELLALAVSVAALAGSLYLSMGMNLKACPLCLYERTFMMGLVGVLLVGLVQSRDVRPGFSVLLCLPLAVAGLCVAAFHVFLELTEVLECPAGLFSLGSAPQQSLAAFLIVTALMGVALARSSIGTAWLITSLGAVVLGILFSGAAIMSAPPLPPPPSEPYTTPLEGCRPSFHRISRTNPAAKTRFQMFDKDVNRGQQESEAPSNALITKFGQPWPLLSGGCRGLAHG